MIKKLAESCHLVGTFNLFCWIYGKKYWANHHGGPNI